MTTIEKFDFIIAIYDIRIAIKNFNVQHAINVQRQNRYVCNTCDVVFRKKNVKTKHFLIHISDRFWKCEQCNRFFRRRNHMNRHILIHQKKEMKSQLIVFNRIAYVCNIDVSMSQLYLRHIVFQKLLQKFQTRHNRRFLKTFCSFCDVFMFLNESKWFIFDEILQYDFCIVLHQRLHNKFEINEKRLVIVCDSCKKHSRFMSRIEFWFDELMFFFYRFRIFLSFLKFMTNLKKTQNVDDFRNNWIIYKIVSNKLSQFIFCSIQFTFTSKFHVRFQKFANFDFLFEYYRKFFSIIFSSFR